MCPNPLSLFSPPKVDPALKAAQKAQEEAANAEKSRQKQALFDQRKAMSAGFGLRSVISGTGAGYGRNFFS